MTFPSLSVSYDEQVGYLNSMRVCEASAHVEVLNPHSFQLDVVPPINATNVALHVVNHFIPVMRDLIRNLPATFPLVLLQLTHL